MWHGTSGSQKLLQLGLGGSCSYPETDQLLQERWREIVSVSYVVILRISNFGL